jgi:mono/diheme cytochrome c family protein
MLLFVVLRFKLRISCYNLYKKNMRTKIVIRITASLLGACIVCAFLSYTPVPVQQQTWLAPATANAMVNPLKGNAESIVAGKKVYVQLCVVCHGDKGKGDGIAGVNLTPRPADHSLPKFQKQADGAIFWKISTGKAPMASYEKLLTPTQRWQVINYLRTLSAIKPS